MDEVAAAEVERSLGKLPGWLGRQPLEHQRLLLGLHRATQAHLAALTEIVEYVARRTARPSTDVVWVEGPGGMSPVQGIFDVPGSRGYFRGRGEQWSVDLWPITDWAGVMRGEIPATPPAWSARGEVTTGCYAAGYLHPQTVEEITAWVVGLRTAGHAGGAMTDLPASVTLRFA